MHWDLVLPVLYLVVVAWIGLRVGRGTQDAESLFLAGRGLGFGVVGTSLFASNISSTTLIGLAGAAYASGIAVASYEWMAALVLLFAAVVLVPVYLRARILTLPDYVEQRFGRRARLYVAGVMVFLSVVVDTAGSLYAGALVLTVFLPQLPLWPTLIALGLFAGLYTAAGGLKAVMLTDALQAGVLLVGSLMITWAAFGHYDFSWSAVRAAVPDDHLHLVLPANDPNLPWPGLLLGLPVLGLYYWTTNQYITQRFLAARSVDHARWGAVLAAGLKVLPLFIMVLPGAMALGIVPGLERADAVFPTLARDLLPVGLRGLVIAAVMAAIMSTIDSALNAASAIVVYDLAALHERGLPPARLLRVARLTTLGFMVFAIAWAPMIARFPGIFAYLQEVFSYVVPPVAVVFIGGVLWRGATRQAAMPALLAGHAVGLALFVATRVGAWPLHFTVNAFLLAVVSSVALVAASRRGGETPEAGHVTLWSPALARVAPGTPWRRDYRVWASVVAAAVVATVLVFF
ncbi:MAG: sodium/solute symporter [Gemmatimonadaceae bacterium]|nr:sodium/solute symporter [Gemmatimonadaceae bacterium]MCW5827360.1 sodium/solute symporter [Gemmatimonadaceae bacterium]